MSYNQCRLSRPKFVVDRDDILSVDHEILWCKCGPSSIYDQTNNLNITKNVSGDEVFRSILLALYHLRRYEVNEKPLDVSI